ncbi:MAG: hypothetical protein WBM50_06770 [Acidimicrobiales bacterium]
MGSKSLLFVLWLLGTVVAAAVAWQSLGFVTDSTEAEQAGTPRSTLESVATTTGFPQTDQPTSVSGIAPPTSVTAATQTTAPDVAVSSSTSAAGTIEQTFDLIGGRAAIRFSPTEVVVVWATPAPGYTASSQREDGGVEIEFSNGVHESKLEAWWSDGPRSETKERDD